MKELGRALILIAAIADLSGCVSHRPATRARATALFSVVLRGEMPESSQPTGLLVGIDGQEGSQGTQFAFPPNIRIPGHYTAFLVRIELAPGPHYLTRLAGVVGAGTIGSRFDVDTHMPFEVKAGSHDYLGHLELSDPGPAAVTRGAPRLVIGDAYDDDLPNLVHAWPALRGHVSRRAGTQGIVTVAARPGNSARGIEERNLEVAAKLDASACDDLAPPARATCRNFLKSDYPRALAVSGGGETGLAVGGKDVIARALQRCRRMSPGNTRACRLFAVDDTLMSSLDPPVRSVALEP
jgi:hypothetical protein